MLHSICSQKLLCLIYHAIVGLRLEYCGTCWGGEYVSNLIQLVVFQKHVVRIIVNKDKIEYVEQLLS